MTTGPPPVAVGPDRLHQLSPRERQIISGIARGLTTAEIAEEMCCAFATVRGRLNLLHARYGARNRAHLLALLMEWHA